MDTKTDCCPLREEKKYLFDAIGQAAHDTRKLYIGLTGCFPVTSNRGTQYMLVLYAYIKKSILVEPIKTRSDADMLRTYDALYGT